MCLAAALSYIIIFTILKEHVIFKHHLHICIIFDENISENCLDKFRTWSLGWQFLIIQIKKKLWIPAIVEKVRSIESDRGSDKNLLM